MSTASLILDDDKELVTMFSHVTFSFVKRSANRVAHLLVRDALFRTGCREWYFNPPVCITDAMILDNDI